MITAPSPSTTVAPAELLTRIEARQRAATASLAALAADLVELRALLGLTPYQVREWMTAPVPQTFAPLPPDGAPIGFGSPVATHEGAPVAQAVAPPEQLPPMIPWYQREGMVSRVIAFVGAGVLLVGVALLLVFAAQSGYFGPVPRTVGGGVLAVALVAAAFGVRHRMPTNAGAIALAASGLAAAYIDLVAVSALYGWLPRTPALLAGEVLAIAGLVLARHWDSQALGVIAVGGALGLAPYVSSSLTTTLLFMVVLTVVTPFVLTGRSWPLLVVVSSMPTALVATFVASMIPLSNEDLPLLVGVVSLLAAVGLWLGWLSRPGTAGFRPDMAVATASLLLPLLTLPALTLGSRLDRISAAMLLFAVGAVLLGAAFWRPLTPAVRGAGGVVGTLAVGLCLLRLAHGQSVLTIALGLALATLAAGVAARDRITLLRGVAFAALGALTWLAPTLRLLALTPDPSQAEVEPIVTSLLVAACAGLLAFEADRRKPPARHAIVYSMLAVVIVAFSAALVGAGILLSSSVGGATDGFRGAHAAVTVSWFVVAGWLLLAGTGGVHRSLRKRFALALAALAVVKLFLFDLAFLVGMARIVAFLVGGIVLIVLAVLYARDADRSHA